MLSATLEKVIPCMWLLLLLSVTAALTKLHVIAVCLFVYLWFIPPFISSPWCSLKLVSDQDFLPKLENLCCFSLKIVWTAPHFMQSSIIKLVYVFLQQLFSSEYVHGTQSLIQVTRTSHEWWVGAIMFDNKNKNHDRDRLWYKLEQWGTKEVHIMYSINYKDFQMSTVTFTMFKNLFLFLKYM